MQSLREKLDWRGGMAELVIIILGVLIALYADRWNEGRQERELATHYIEALKQDLQADTTALAQNVGAVEDFAQHARQVLALLDGGSWDGTPEDLARAIEFSQFLAWNYPVPLSTGTIDDLRATGNLRLISEDVRNALAPYYGAIEQAEVWARQWQDIQLAGFSVRAGVFTVDQRLMITGEVGRQPLPSRFYLDNELPESPTLRVSEAEAGELLRRLRATPGLRTELVNMLYVHAWVWDQTEFIKAQARVTLEALEAYTR